MRQGSRRSPAALGALALLGVTCVAAPAWAQQRPLVTEDPETIGAGRVLVEAGFDYGRDVQYPVSGLTGNLLRVPLLGVSVGLGSFAEFQIDGGLYDRLSITQRDAKAPLAGLVTATGDSTSAVDDIVVGTKISARPPDRRAMSAMRALPSSPIQPTGTGSRTCSRTASRSRRRSIRASRWWAK